MPRNRIQPCLVSINLGDEDRRQRWDTLSRLKCLMKDSINSAGFYFTISGVEFVNR